MTSTQVKTAALTLAFAGTVFFWILAATVIRYTETPPPPKIVYFGGLTPGNDPPIPLPPGVSADTVQLLLGDDLRVLSSSSNPVFTKGGKPFLSIGIRDGKMVLTTTLADKNGEWICRIRDNEFQASQERAFNPKQPDEHSLLVRDADGVEILNVRFGNPKMIRITGRFQLPGSTEPILIDSKKGIVWPGGGGIGHLTLNIMNPGAGFIAF